jgi:hypothetical protein
LLQLLNNADEQINSVLKSWDSNLFLTNLLDSLSGWSKNILSAVRHLRNGLNTDVHWQILLHSTTNVCTKDRNNAMLTIPGKCKWALLQTTCDTPKRT